VTESKIRATIANCVVALVKYDMRNRSLSSEDAYRALYVSELYRLLQNPATRLYLETNAELARYYELELNRGPQALMEFFRAEELSV